MKLLVVLIIALAAFLAVAERPSVPLAQTDWSAVSPAAEITTVATKKDLLVYADASAGSSPSNGKRNAFGTAPAPAGGPVMSVRRRNADGVYVLVGNFTEAASQYATTNGKWVAMYFGNIGFFSVDANNQMSNLSVISNSGVQSGFLLSDDTFVAYDSVSPLDDGNYTIRTFEYEASNNTWQEIAGIGLVVTYGVASQSGVSTYVVTDTHLVALDPSNSSRFVINIYERQADKSWKFVEAVPVNNTLGYINYNSVDTLTMWLPVPDESGSAYGVLFVYTKVNGKWIDQRFSTTSVGFSPVGYFGIITAFLDANNMLASAPFEGYSGSGNPTNAGKVLLMTRNDGGLWEPAADLTGSGLFGTGIGFNDYDVVIPSFDLSSSSVLSFYTAPICFYEPINVTCSNQQVSDCSQVNITSLYTVNNPQCGAVKATIGGFGLVDNKALEAQFSFTKGFGASYSCNATVTCPVPPIAVQQTPSKVSSSVGVQFGLVSIFGLVAVLFL